MNLLSPYSKQYPIELTAEDIAVKSSCLHEDVDSAVRACIKAQSEFCLKPKALRASIVDEIRSVTRLLASDFAWWAICETKRGNYEDKISKQLLAANKTPGPEDIQATAISGDLGLTVIEFAPYGVLGAVTPITNPTATIIHNVICMISAGNGIIFNAHPSAMNCTNRVIAVFNQVVIKNGGPDSLICGIAKPTVESSQILLKHPDITANVVTGGPAVVKVAISSGKKCFAAGPGNPPVVVDETADIQKAAKCIITGAQFDNNMICSDEKEVFVVESVADNLMKEMVAAGAQILTNEEIKKFEEICFKEKVDDFTHGKINPLVVGLSPQNLMQMIGGTAHSACRMLICEVRDGHPFVYTELLTSILPIVRVKSFEDALMAAVKAEHGYRHTSSIYSQDVTRITEMGRRCGTSIFTVNGNHLTGLACGGEGYTALTITGYTGEGMTRPRTFSRERRVVYVGSFNY